MKFLFLSRLMIVGCFVSLMASCSKRNFKVVDRLQNHPNTTFVATLETPISKGKNVVYAATMPILWEEVRHEINQPIEVQNKNSELQLLHQTKSHLNVLDRGEYEVTADVQNGAITGRAFFKKSLPFKAKFASFDNELKFKQKTVPAFGMLSVDKKLLKNIDIIYFNNENDFIIKLLPKNAEHEIILYKNSESQASSLGELVNQVKEKTKLGELERQKNFAKFRFNHGDKLLIPKLSFHLEDNYKSLEGQKFKTNEQEYQIRVAYQRNAFLLDEKGAKVESEARMKSMSAAPLPNEVEPKIMYFNDSFLVMLRKRERKNPYFAVWVEDTDFMTK